jgi:hypothetical protein
MDPAHLARVRFGTRATSAARNSATSPMTTVAESSGSCADASSSTQTTVAPAPNAVPCRVVHLPRLVPSASTKSAAETIFDDGGDAKPPQIPSDQGLAENIPFTAAVVASSPRRHGDE